MKSFIVRHALFCLAKVAEQLAEIQVSSLNIIKIIIVNVYAFIIITIIKRVFYNILPARRRFVLSAAAVRMRARVCTARQ